MSFAYREQAVVDSPPRDSDLAPRTFRKIAVFCGASAGNDPVYIEAARELGREMVRRGIGLVYGGGSIGLMGSVAETVGAPPPAGLGPAAVFGVIPAALAPREVSGPTVGEIVTVGSMHERKALMFEAADAFITLPGGYGTLDETLEITTWHQLGFHKKPVGLLNTAGFFDGLLAFFDRATENGFIRPCGRAIVLSHSSPAALIDALAAHRPSRSLIRMIVDEGGGGGGGGREETDAEVVRRIA